ncbi:MAG: N-acetylmuramic acid 6-phosphate etherase, partial [Sphingomicrobium sp.]
AGTSGRLAVLDGVELGPTFGWPPERLHYGLAGGMDALTKSIENAEDDVQSGRDFVAAARLNPDDVAVGVSASGTTPFTLAAIREASSAGALTVAIAGNAGTPLLLAAKHPILLDTGAELVSGSTRMKAGTAQKVALNLFSTAVMLKLGRVYKSLMVDMRISNRKLRSRAVSAVAQISGVASDAAEAALDRSGGNIKLASLLAMGMDLEGAHRCLAACGNDLRVAIQSCRGQ